MPIQQNSLSVALRSLADFLSCNIGEEVMVTMAPPSKTYEHAKTSNARISIEPPPYTRVLCRCRRVDHPQLLPLSR